MSVIQKIYDSLKEQGFDAYFPGQKKGECTRKYVVVKDDGGVEVVGISSERPIYTIMCYVPENKYSLMGTYKLEVKEAMRKLYPMVMYAGNETPSYYDSNVKGHMVSFQYYGIRKIKQIIL